MSEVMYGPTVRIRRIPSELGGDDLVVEIRQQLGRISDPTYTGPRWPFPTYQWVEKKRANEMSNGSAFTDCDRVARHYRQQATERDWGAATPSAPATDNQEGHQEPS